MMSDVSVRLSMMEVHWRIIANLGFKFQSKFTTHCGRGEGNLNNKILRYASHYWALLSYRCVFELHFSSLELLSLHYTFWLDSV